MTAWGIATYGDPCRGCGFGWALDEAAADRMVAAGTVAFIDAVAGAGGATAGAGEGWGVTAYTLHLADNLRVWAERLVGLAAGRTAIVPYDQDLLAEVRSYRRLPGEAALWSLERATGDWFCALDLVGAAGRVAAEPLALLSEERGRLTVGDCRRLLAHEVHHHLADVRRLVGRAQAPS